MEADPLATEILFHIGPVPISLPVATTWGIMLVMAVFFGLAMRRPKPVPGPVQAVMEILVTTLESQLRAILGRDPWPFMPLLGSLFIFLVVANLSAILPGVSAPTGHLETPAALALIVFVSVHYFGIRTRGLRAYLKHYLEPSPMLLPLNILEEVTRTFSLMIRLFGNMMSHEFVVAIILVLAGLIVPVPFLLLGILIGIIQAYIFTVLATVYIGAAIGATES